MEFDHVLFPKSPSPVSKIAIASLPSGRLSFWPHRIAQVAFFCAWVCICTSRWRSFNLGQTFLPSHHLLPQIEYISKVAKSTTRSSMSAKNDYNRVSICLIVYIQSFIMYNQRCIIELQKIKNVFENQHISRDRRGVQVRRSLALNGMRQIVLFLQSREVVKRLNI